MYRTGSAINGEGANYAGQIEGDFLGLYEDDLLEPIIWSNDLREELKADAEKWRVASGLTPNDISWGDTMRAGRNPQQSAAEACCVGRPLSASALARLTPRPGKGGADLPSINNAGVSVVGKTGVSVVGKVGVSVVGNRR